MSDSRRVYRGIKTSLRQLFPKQWNGDQDRHLEAMARKAPDESKVERQMFIY